jgi:hypothetical protein
MTGAALPVATGHAARLRHRAGLPALALVGARRMRGARTGLACGAASGNPAPGRGPAGCLLFGLPWPSLRRQGMTPRQEPPPGHTVDGSSHAMGRRDRSPGAGEERGPTSRQEARTVADHTWDPTRAGTC